jgi:hypothetical protein
VRARHIAVAVLGQEAAEDRVAGRPATGPDGGNARAHRIAGDERAMANLDAGNIGDSVEGAGDSFEYHAEIARPGLGLRRGESGGEEQLDGESHNGGIISLPVYGIAA